MIGARIWLKTLTPAVFQRTCYKQGSWVEVYSYDWVPQSALYGAVSVALSSLGASYDVLDGIHLSSASPACPKCKGPTFFARPGEAYCLEHGQAKARKEAVLPKTTINSRYGGQWDWADSKEGIVPSPSRLMAPRRIHALASNQWFSFLAYCDSEQHYKALLKALRLLCVYVNDEEGAGLGMGKFKRSMGSFEAYTRRFKPEKLGCADAPVRAQSPVPLKLHVSPTPDAAVYHPQVRNIHYIPEARAIPSLLEGSGFLDHAGRLQMYTTDVEGISAVFGSLSVNRRIADYEVKALEAFAVAGLPTPEPKGRTLIDNLVTPFRAPVTHPVVEEARRKADEELTAVYAKATSHEKLRELLKPVCEELAQLCRAAGVKGAYNWKEVADALIHVEGGKLNRTCAFCGAPARYLVNLCRVTNLFLPTPKERKMWVINPLAVTADFWTDRPHGAKLKYGVCPACLYAIVKHAPAKPKAARTEKVEEVEESCRS